MGQLHCSEARRASALAKARYASEDPRFGRIGARELLRSICTQLRLSHYRLRQVAAVHAHPSFFGPDPPWHATCCSRSSKTDREHHHMTIRILALTTAAFLTVTLGAPTVTEAADPQFAGPRNTIARPLSVERSSKIEAMAGLRAARDETAECATVRATHRGHPGKGVTRVAKVRVDCSQARMSRVR